MLHTAHTVSDAILGPLTETRAMHPMALSKCNYFTTPCLNVSPFTDNCTRCGLQWESAWAFQGALPRRFRNYGVREGPN